MSQPAGRHPTAPATSTVGTNTGVGSTTTPASVTSSPVSVASRYVVLSNTVDYQWSNPYQWVGTIGSITTPAFAAQQRSIASQYLDASAAGHSNPVLERKWTIQQQQERSDSAVVTGAAVTRASGIARSSQVVRVTYQEVTFTAQAPRPTAIGPPATAEITALRSGGSWLVGAVGPSGLGS
ncbi:MAG: potassium-transporting ATPase subunit C [Acidimicrobiales bacterium]